MLLPENTDLSQIGVKTKDLHFITAGSKGLSRNLFYHLINFNILGEFKTDFIL